MYKFFCMFLTMTYSMPSPRKNTHFYILLTAKVTAKQHGCQRKSRVFPGPKGLQGNMRIWNQKNDTFFLIEPVLSTVREKILAIITPSMRWVTRNLWRPSETSKWASQYMTDVHFLNKWQWANCLTVEMVSRSYYNSNHDNQDRTKVCILDESYCKPYARIHPWDKGHYRCIFSFHWLPFWPWISIWEVITWYVIDKKASSAWSLQGQIGAHLAQTFSICILMWLSSRQRAYIYLSADL